MEISTLIKVARWGAVLSFGGAAAIYYTTRAGINRSPFYALAVQEARKNEEAMRALGGELHPESVHLFGSGRRTRVLADRAEIVIPVTGAKDEAGQLIVAATLVEPGKGGPLDLTAKWNLDKLVLEAEWPKVMNIVIVEPTSEPTSESPASPAQA